MKCYYCKADIPDGADLCPQCGKQQMIGRELIDAARNGDQSAITDLYNRTYNGVYNTVRFLIKDEDTALDILQDSYIKAFSSLDQLQEAGKFEPWVKRIAHNRAVDYLRRTKPVTFSSMVSDDSDEAMEFEDDRPDSLPDVVMDRKETARLINEILDSLPEDQRMCIALYYSEQLSIQEIAEELGIPEATVKSRLQYGRKKIEAKVRDLEKKGTKLYSIAPIPFLMLLFRQQAQTAPAPAAVLHGILSETAGSAASAAGTAAAETAAGIAKGAAGHAAVHAAGTAIGTKIIAAVAAVAVLGGAGTVLIQHVRRAEPEPVAIVEETEEPVQTAEAVIATPFETVSEEMPPETEPACEEIPEEDLVPEEVVPEEPKMPEYPPGVPTPPSLEKPPLPPEEVALEAPPVPETPSPTPLPEATPTKEPSAAETMSLDAVSETTFEWLQDQYAFYLHQDGEEFLYTYDTQGDYPMPEELNPDVIAEYFRFGGSVYAGLGDLNEDGTEELVIAQGNETDKWAWSVYATDGVNARELYVSERLGYRVNLYVLPDGLFMIHGSGGAAAGSDTICRIAADGSGLEVIAEYTYDEAVNGSMDHFSDSETLTDAEFTARYWDGAVEAAHVDGIRFVDLTEETAEETPEISVTPGAAEPAAEGATYQEAYQAVLLGYQMCMSEGLNGDSPYLAYEKVREAVEFRDGSRVLRYALCDVNQDGVPELIMALEMPWEDSNILVTEPFEVYTFDGTGAIPLFAGILEDDDTLHVGADGVFRINKENFDYAALRQYILPPGQAAVENIEDGTLEYWEDFPEDAVVTYNSILKNVS